MSASADARREVARAAPWTLATYGATKAVTVLTAVVLARLLDPADFGLVALATLITGFFFTDLGVSGSLVLVRDLGERVGGTMYSLMAGAGVAGAVLVAALSPAIAAAFDEPRLDGVVAVTALTALFSGTSIFYDALFQRAMEFRRRFAVQLTQTLAYAAIAIGLAIAGAGVWSMVVAQVAAAAILAGGSLALATQRVRPRFDRAAAREAILRGRGFWGQNMLVFAEDNADYFAVGQVLGPRQLGFYSMAYRMGQLPYQAIADPIAKVTFPVFARLRAAGHDLSGTFLGALAGVALVAAPVGLVMSGAAEPFVLAIFGAEWAPMAGPLVPLGLWAALAPLNSTLGWLFNSAGEADRLAVYSAVRLVLLLPAVLIAAWLGGITTVAWVLVAHLLATVLLLAAVAARRLGVPLRRQWHALRPVLLAAPVAWFATHLVADALAGEAAGVALVAAALAGAAAYLAVVLALARPLVIRTWQAVATRGRGNP